VRAGRRSRYRSADSRQGTAGWRVAKNSESAVERSPAEDPQYGRGMEAESLIVCPYDPRWRREFERLRDRAWSVVGDLAIGVEHVGSTAVPGLAAKPVVDLDVIVRNRGDVDQALAHLATLGYQRDGRSGLVAGIDGLAAPRWPPGERRHHLYVVVAGSRVQRDRLAFRDYLRSHPQQAQRYAELKQRAAHARGDWDRYAQLKHQFIDQVLRSSEHR
jgi:GrpB-like predicted nucleotidyltransferase (UPF0157 family)